jgi:hypothetical protein
MRRCKSIVFDHVKVRAASRAVRFEQHDPGDENKCILFKHCEFDGGAPTCLFRSDRKDNYFFGPDNPNAPQEAIQENTLGSATTGALISSGAGSSNITVHHCEFLNGHDVLVFGDRMRFHHNWVHNINDDAIAIAADGAGASNAWIYQNVITKYLTGLSFGVQEPAGDLKIFRNLIDLREPTAGIRPAVQGENKSLRQGYLWKGDKDEGPLTCGTTPASYSTQATRARIYPTSPPPGSNTSQRTWQRTGDRIPATEDLCRSDGREYLPPGGRCTRCERQPVPRPQTRWEEQLHVRRY